MRHLTISLAVVAFLVSALLALVAVPVLSAADEVLFNNGDFSGPQTGRIMGPHTILDDFALQIGATITGVEWSQHDEPTVSYEFTEITFYSGGVPSTDNLINSVTVVATRTPNDTGLLFGLEGFDYSVAGLSIHLNPGTYWMGLRSVFPNGGATWDETVGNESTIPGRYQAINGSFPPNFKPDEDSVFRMIGVLDPFDDIDADGVPDFLDNCPNDFNPGQDDRDGDGIGDVCDPFPDDPNNELAQCFDDLAACEAVPAFVDSDGDGEEDSTDACPGTLVSRRIVVDQAGCSLWQFCAAIDVRTNTGTRVCRNIDWHNDEPITKPKDCVVDKQVQPPVCVPAQ